MKYLSQIEVTRFFGYKNHNSIQQLVRQKKLPEYKLGLTGRKYYLNLTAFHYFNNLADKNMDDPIEHFSTHPEYLLTMTQATRVLKALKTIGRWKR